METPSSTRRITRSQTKSSLHNKNNKISTRKNGEESATKSTQKTRRNNQERAVLVDITNDSPIVGLASGNLNETPISNLSKQRSYRYKSTPGSGEALLRGQVKNLLQKVEEEAEVSKFISLDSGSRHGLKAAFLCSPAGLLAPTPANTPLVLNFNVEDEECGVELSPIEDQLTVSKALSGISEGIEPQQQSNAEAEKDVISRSLFLDFSDKSDSLSDCASVLTHQENNSSIRKSPLKDVDDDDSSIWSIQVNASTRDEDEDDEVVIQDDLVQADDDDFTGEDGIEDVEADSDVLLNIDELCQGIKNICVNGAEFKGKHTRFVYNSDDELVELEEDSAEVLRLKGLPTPKGKHLRFLEDEE